MAQFKACVCNYKSIPVLSVKGVLKISGVQPTLTSPNRAHLLIFFLLLVELCCHGYEKYLRNMN